MMNMMYYRMINSSGMGYYHPGALTNGCATTAGSLTGLNGAAPALALPPSGLAAVPGVAAAGGAAGGGLAAGGACANGLSPPGLSAAAGLVSPSGLSSVMPKFILPNFTATQIQYMVSIEIYRVTDICRATHGYHTVMSTAVANDCLQLHIFSAPMQ